MSPLPILVMLASVSPAPCIPVEGEHILAVDLARAVPAFAGLPPELALGFAPAPGGRRTFAAAELVRLAQRYGVAVEPGSEVCFARLAETLTRERVASALQAVLPAAHIEVIDFSHQPLPRGELRFLLSGLDHPVSATQESPLVWRGAVCPPGQPDFPVWAKVRVRVVSTQVIATDALPPDRPITQRQLHEEPYEGPPGLPTLSEILGRAPRRQIPAGAVIEARWLTEPQDVVRGEPVRVEVRSGLARLMLEGQAQSSGRRGETVSVRNPSNGKIFRARVVGQAKVAAGTDLEGSAR